MPSDRRYLVGNVTYTLIQRHRTIRETSKGKSHDRKYRTLEAYLNAAREIADRGTRI